VDRSTTRGKALSAGYLGYVALPLVPLYYSFTSFRALLIERPGIYNQTDLLMGAMVIAALLIAVWTVSRLIWAVAVFGLVYAYYGELLPGILEHSGLSLSRIITMNTVEMQGIYGSLTQISATWIVVFIMLAGLIEMYGGMKAFIKGITRFVAQYRYLEIGHIAVLSSMVFGSINGAATANSATTGAFTIPMMKENRYPPRFAAAIEAVASSGGQVLPPVMGSSAFLMAELIDPSYADIVLASAAPAIMLYLTVAVGITLYVGKHDIEKVAYDVPEREGGLGESVRRIAGYYDYLVTLLILLYYLLYVQASPMKSGFYAILVMLGLRASNMLIQGYRDDRLGPEAAQYVRQSFEGFLRGAETMVNITIMIASLGIVVRAFVVTGLAQNLSAFLIELSAGSAVALILLAAVASIVFGMGMPTLAAYILVALFVAPSLLQTFDVSPLAVHLFVFYFAIVSNITPPIAIAVVITQGIADAEFLPSAINSIKLGYAMFVIPFVFIYQTSILHLDSVLVTPVVVFVGLLLVAVGLIGFAGDSLPIRAVAVLSGGLVLFGPALAQVAAAVVAVAVGYYAYRQRPKTSVPV
jgi:TRAP transporter 4TM/12TM fusion protein